MSDWIECNLKADMPTLDVARRRLADTLARAKQRKCRALKIIHGYGSSGTGGRLRIGIQASLRKRRKEGVIRDFVPGERWSIFDETARSILDACPSLKRDPDLDRGNEGVCVVLL